MDCLLIFDYSNDVIYTKYNKQFLLHIKNTARSQGLLPTDSDQSTETISSNIIVQLFSPLVTSQRIMSCQFGNSYSSIECEDGLNMVFEEFMGYLFVNIGSGNITFIKRFLSVCVTLVRYLCGPDVLLLKDNAETSNVLSNLVGSWMFLYNTEQLLLIDAIEQLMVNSDLSSATLQAANDAVEKLQSVLGHSKIHALIFVRSKFLALYSSRNASLLSPRDMLFLTLLCNIQGPEDSNIELDSTEHDSIKETTHSYQVLFSGNDFTPKCVPHVVHVIPIIEGVNLLLIIEVGSSSVSSSLYDTFYNLNLIQTIQMQQDVETLKPAVENLDVTAKRLINSLKKANNSNLDLSLKQLIRKWDYMKKKYVEFFKNNSSESLLRAESCTMGLLDILKGLLGLTAFDNSILNSSQICINEISRLVADRLEAFNDFLKAKALCNFTLGSDSLTINKYLEEFPGLVHFIYIDRTTHRVTTPTLDFTSPEAINLTKKKIWAMIEFARHHLQEGHLSLMWKDTTFNYSYFLWFEDTSGSPLSPSILPTNTPKALPSPGLLCGDFYQKIKEACFPKMSPNKVRCYELFCIHLGLVTASCVLEHTRRLAATVWELRGYPNHPIDLL